MNFETNEKCMSLDFIISQQGKQLFSKEFLMKVSNDTIEKLIFYQCCEYQNGENTK